MKCTRPDGLGTVICTRQLVRESDNKRKVTAVVQIGRPRRQNQNWICPFYISRIGLREPILAYGEDSFQALTTALAGIRVTTEKSGVRWSWVYGKKGDIGFPRFVPMGFGVNFSRKIERLIDRELAEFAEAVERRSRRRTKR
jgi:hypothetical protein